MPESASHGAVRPPSASHLPLKHTCPDWQGIVRGLHAPIDAAGTAQAPMSSHTRFTSQSAEVVHGDPELPSSTQVPHIEPAGMRQYPEPHWLP